MEGLVGVGIRFLHPSCCLLSKKSIIVLLTKLHKMLYNPLGAAAQSASDEQTWSELGQACPSEAMQEQSLYQVGFGFTASIRQGKHN